MPNGVLDENIGNMKFDSNGNPSTTSEVKNAPKPKENKKKPITITPSNGRKG